MENLGAWGLAFLSEVGAIPEGAGWLATVLGQMSDEYGVGRLQTVGRALGYEHPAGDHTVTGGDFLSGLPGARDHLAWWLRDTAREVPAYYIIDDAGLVKRCLPQGRVWVDWPLAAQFIGQEGVRLMGVTIRLSEIRQGYQGSFPYNCCFLRYGREYRNELERLVFITDMGQYLVPGEAATEEGAIRLASPSSGGRRSGSEYTDTLLRTIETRRVSLRCGREPTPGYFHNIGLAFRAGNRGQELWVTMQLRDQRAPMELVLDWDALAAAGKVRGVMLTSAEEPEISEED
jgi:hypothetical protein